MQDTIISPLDSPFRTTIGITPDGPVVFSDSLYLIEIIK